MSVQTPGYLRFDGMTWPNPDAAGEAQWRILYGEPTRADFLLVASVVSAYGQLVEDSQRRRNEKVAGIRRTLKETRVEECDRYETCREAYERYCVGD